MQLKALVLFALISLLAACSSAPPKQSESVVTADTSALSKQPEALLKQPEPVPVEEPPSKTGNPSSYVVFGKRYRVLGSSAGFSEQGLASWYGKKFHGRKTSSGALYDMYKITAAHKNLPIPTYARVTRLDNGHSVVVKINDRGPFVKGRIIDLSYAAPLKLDMLREGTVPVEVVALSPYQVKNGNPDQQIAASADRAIDEQAKNYQALNETMSPLLSPSESGGTSQTAQDSAALVQREMDLGTFFIQVGAFSKRQSAEQLQQRLSNSLGRQTHISEHQGLYRVRIGPLTEHAELGPLKEQLVAMGLEQPRVIY